MKRQVVTVYILRSLTDAKRYVGITHDKDARLKEHNSGKVISTRSRRPFVRTYCEEFEELLDAREREKYFKTAAGRRYLSKVESPIWEDMRSPTSRMFVSVRNEAGDSERATRPTGRKQTNPGRPGGQPPEL